MDVASSDMNGQGQANITDINDFTANSKSFDIPHPTKGEPWRLRYGVLEGPEHGVYFRGMTTQNIILLPDYWKGLVHSDSYTVTLTPIGKPCQHYVEKIQDHVVYINCECGEIHTYYFIQAERKDVEKVKLEYIRENEDNV